MILNNIKSDQRQRGFTIVELLVVIVVIGILAAITIVSYTGISDRAKTSSNQQNASNVASAANIVYANTSVYPVTSSGSVSVVGNLNASDAKIPTGLTVTNALPAAGATASNIAYLQKANTGFCVGYWDYTPTAAVKWIYGGDATTVSGTTCS